MQSRFEQWRQIRQRKAPIPDELWAAAAAAETGVRRHASRRSSPPARHAVEERNTEAEAELYANLAAEAAEEDAEAPIPFLQPGCVPGPILP
jgi:hypothetical protein